MSNEYDIAEDEAANWVIALSESPNDLSQQERFEAWLSASAINAEAWARTEFVYARIAEVKPTTEALWPQRKLDSMGETSTNQDELRTNTEKKNLFCIRNMIPVLALAACVALVLFPSLKLRLSADFITETAEQRTIDLEDGSRVYLAPESAIAVDFSMNERQVRLLKGDAFFEVSTDPDRPFIVDVDGARVTVLGTSFNVHRSEEGPVVCVAYGRVKVEGDSSDLFDTEILTKGQKLAVVKGGITVRSEVSPHEIGLWRQGELIARDVPIADIVDALRDYHSGAIVIPGSFAQRRVTGLYRLDTPEETLRDLAASHGARVSAMTPWVLRVSEK
ncbi:FecR domain-containing protein [Puniceicoccaceae bacterium K14]|nr:FecR domain-containing protein [Puniceicoccaceae bacterium K14]